MGQQREVEEMRSGYGMPHLMCCLDESEEILLSSLKANAFLSSSLFIEHQQTFLRRHFADTTKRILFNLIILRPHKLASF